MKRALRTFTWAAAVAFVLQPATLHACPACYGQSNDAMAIAYNWGILSLLFVIVSVLGAIVAFFVHVARRTARYEERFSNEPLPSTDHV